MAAQSKSKIKQSLLKQLENLGANTEHYIDLIDDYMGLWEVKTALLKDIKSRGVTFIDVSSTGVKMQKNNPSVKELVLVNKQMLSLLKELSLTVNNIGGDDEDEL